MVHQHFMLIPTLTVWENVLLGTESIGKRRRRIDSRPVKQKLEELASRYGLRVDPDATVSDLSVGEQQRVEILKALHGDARCLILDEPTAVLTPGETRQLFEIIRSLTTAGCSVVFISHKLNEIMEIADRVSVLRRGKVVGTVRPSDVTDRELARMMVGREVSVTTSKTPAHIGGEIMRLADIVSENRLGVRVLDECTISIRSGEILAIAGVEGNGQSELAEVLAGLRTPHGGKLIFDGDDVTTDTPLRRHRRGIGYIPDDRKRVGLVTEFSIRDNLALKEIKSAGYSRRGVIDRDALRRNAETAVRDYDVRCESIEQSCASLSGGNQQKVVVARECGRDLRVLVASQPTRGLDVGAIEYVHKRLIAQRDAGAAVVVLSAELDEVLALGDRVSVMYRGKISATLNRQEASYELVGSLMAGGGLVTSKS
jgi:simple sugar transport system ATP-binding protein